MSFGDPYYFQFPNAPSHGAFYESQQKYQYKYQGQHLAMKGDWGPSAQPDIPADCDEQLIEFLTRTTHQVLYLNPFADGHDWSAIGKAGSHLESSGATPTHLIFTPESRKHLVKSLIGSQKIENNPWGLRDVTIPGPARFSTALVAAFPSGWPQHPGEIPYRMVWLVRPDVGPLPHITYP
jgi:hypothetical protein